MRRRLQKLFHVGYLDRVYDPLEARRYRLEQLGSPKAIYATGSRGVGYLEDTFAYPSTRTRWDQVNRKSTAQHIQHTLMVTRFALALFQAVDRVPHLELLPVSATLGKLFAPQDRYTDPFSWFYMGKWIKHSLMARSPQGKLEKAVFYPDGFFAIRDHHRPAGKNRAFFFLEADAGTFSRPRLAKKFLAHAAYSQAIRQGKNPLRLSGFRVLHLSVSQKRADNIWTLAQKLVTKGLISDSLHRFTSEQRYDSGSVLDSIWKHPDSDQPCSIF